MLGPYVPPDPPRDRVWLHVLLFAATLASMVLVSAFVPAVGVYIARDVVYEAGGWTARLADGLRYAVPFLTFLTVHEFGHYLTARRYGISTSLPYFLPVPLPGALGTFGAVIRIREPFRQMRALFDVGAAGPLAGAVVAIAVYTVGVLTLPAPDYLLGVGGHAGAAETLARTGAFPPFDLAGLGPNGAAIVFGDTPLTHLIGGLGPYRVPGHEIMHYPLLLAGWLALFFTALNLLPVGQLDGGHVVYALFGPRVHAVVARATVMAMTFSAALGAVHGGASVFGFTSWQAPLVVGLLVAVAMAKLFDGRWRLVARATALVVGSVALVEAVLPDVAAAVGFAGWTFWIGLILFLIRVDHPYVPPGEPLGRRRRVLGYLCLVLFVLSFSVQPFAFVFGQ